MPLYQILSICNLEQLKKSMFREIMQRRFNKKRLTLLMERFEGRKSEQKLIRALGKTHRRRQGWVEELLELLLEVSVEGLLAQFLEEQQGDVLAGEQQNLGKKLLIISLKHAKDKNQEKLKKLIQINLRSKLSVQLNFEVFHLLHCFINALFCLLKFHFLFFKSFV